MGLRLPRAAVELIAVCAMVYYLNLDYYIVTKLELYGPYYMSTANDKRGAVYG